MKFFSAIIVHNYVMEKKQIITVSKVILGQYAKHAILMVYNGKKVMEDLQVLNVKNVKIIN